MHISLASLAVQASLASLDGCTGFYLVIFKSTDSSPVFKRPPSPILSISPLVHPQQTQQIIPSRPTRNPEHNLLSRSYSLGSYILWLLSVVFGRSPPPPLLKLVYVVVPCKNHRIPIPHLFDTLRYITPSPMSVLPTILEGDSQVDHLAMSTQTSCLLQCAPISELDPPQINSPNVHIITTTTPADCTSSVFRPLFLLIRNMCLHLFDIAPSPRRRANLFSNRNPTHDWVFLFPLCRLFPGMVTTDFRPFRRRRRRS
jgi:hypothetical protein